MAVWTEFSLNVFSGGDAGTDYEAAISNHIGFSPWYNMYSDSKDWENWQSDMVEFSKLHPEVVFELKGDGCDGENWKAYFKDGSFQLCEARTVYDQFDPQKLGMTSKISLEMGMALPESGIVEIWWWKEGGDLNECFVTLSPIWEIFSAQETYRLCAGEIIEVYEHVLRNNTKKLN